jgi:hypothetical protein
MMAYRTAVAVLLWLLAGSGPLRAEPNCNVGVEFHPSGGVRACVLNGHHRLHTERAGPITCADGTRVEQHADGTLARCTLLEPARVEGQDCARGAVVRFAPDGALARCAHETPG